MKNKKADRIFFRISNSQKDCQFHAINYELTL